MLQDDFMVKQVQRLAHMLARLVFHKDAVFYDTSAGTQELSALQAHLIALLQDGEVNGAENDLFDAMPPDDIRYLEIAIDFYARLNELIDDELEAADYSRQEIEEGLRDAATHFGITLM